MGDRAQMRLHFRGVGVFWCDIVDEPMVPLRWIVRSANKGNSLAVHYMIKVYVGWVARRTERVITLDAYS